MNESETFSERLKKWRARIDVRQPEAAKLLNIGRTYYSELENGREPGKFLKQKFALIETAVRANRDIDHEVKISEQGNPYGNEPRGLLQKRREELGISLAEMAQRTRFKVAFIRDVEAGNMRGSNEKFLRKAAKILQLEPQELLGGSDHPETVGDSHVQTFGSLPKVNLTDKLTAKTIPLISMAQAGDLVEFEDVYDYEGVIAYAGKDPRAIAVRIRGESMSPDYAPGTIAILYPSFKPRNDNLIVAKTKDGNVLFKRLQLRDNEVIFHSINPNYEPMKYTERDLVWMYPVGLTQRVEI